MLYPITVSKSEIFDLLARTTGYIGAKATDSDSGAYRRVSINADDRKLLDRFFREGRDRLCLALRRLISSESVSDDGDSYVIALDLSEAFDQSLISTIRSGIVNFFVQDTAAKWLAITDKALAQEYAMTATEALDYISRKVYAKRPPSRPVFTD